MLDTLPPSFDHRVGDASYFGAHIGLHHGTPHARGVLEEEERASRK